MARSTPSARGGHLKPGAVRPRRRDSAASNRAIRLKVIDDPSCMPTMLLPGCDNNDGTGKAVLMDGNAEGEAIAEPIDVDDPITPAPAPVPAPTEPTPPPPPPPEPAPPAAAALDEPVLVTPPPGAAWAGFLASLGLGLAALEALYL